jgi:hypothetical protein
MNTAETRRTTAAVWVSAVLLAVATLWSHPSAAGKTLLTIDELQWDGTFAFPRTGDVMAGGAGSTSYASGALAVRYVGAQRRFLMPLFTNMNPTTGQTFGDLVEWQAPLQTPYNGSDPTQAPAMIETRRWKNWTVLPSTPAWQDPASGVRIGGLWWDEAQGVLWYQLYGYYSDRNQPFLGATQLLDAVDGNGYRTVGKQYGPWWYRSNDPSDRTNLYWKAVCNWIVPIPESSRTDLKGNKVIFGGTVGAIGGSGHLGPGFRAQAALPPLSDPPNTVVPLGLRLADYTKESPLSPPHARRDTNYQFDGAPYSSSDSGLYPPNGGVGYWQMSLDQVNSFIWVDTPMKEGILLFGRAATGMHWYGFNPRSATPGWAWQKPDAVDPTREIPNSNGYGSAGWTGAIYLFDPAQVREVGRGARSPWADGINPLKIADWHAQWPNLPVNRYKMGATAAQSRPIESTISNTGFWDATAQEIIWIQPMSVGSDNPQPTLNIFHLGPERPTGLRILK